MRHDRRSMMALVAALILIGAALGTAMSDTAVAAEDGKPTAEFRGRGWGHGRGMGQYGALGYAQDHGWNTNQILDHYYGGTTGGQAPASGIVNPGQIRVELRSMAGRSTTVGLAGGRIRVQAADGRVVTHVTGAVRLMSDGSGMVISTGSTCRGPWTVTGRVDGSLVKLIPELAGGVRADADSTAGLLEVCGPNRSTWYDGQIWATVANGSQRSLNVLPTDHYLRGVVPNEVPASWPSEVLGAQAVAARSYSLSGDSRRSSFADTCDDISCQVYRGRFIGDRANPERATDPRTDAAIANTAGVVRLNGAGQVARTEFSSSTGGHTAGGTFPAVVDLGDAVAANPNHRWSASVDLTSIEERYNLGAIQEVRVRSRNGHGADGGRAQEVEYRFERGSVVVTATEARRQLGLRSEWFTVGPVRRGGPTSPEHDALAKKLVTDLYKTALGRNPDEAGRRYWESRMADGVKFEHVGTLFYGSPEYVRRSGGSNDRFVTALYRDLLGRTPDPAGRGYWLGQLATGRVSSADVANAFFRSVESRRARSRALLVLAGRKAPTKSEIDAAADRLTQIDDLQLGLELAQS